MTKFAKTKKGLNESTRRKEYYWVRITIKLYGHLFVRREIALQYTGYT